MVINRSKLLEEAIDLFWFQIAEAYPTATSGDFSPEGSMAFEAAAKKAFDEWVDNNVPEADRGE
jgi:hypothetical protein